MSTSFGSEFGNELLIMEPGTSVEQILECVAEGGLVLHSLRAQRGERAVVFADEGVSGRDLSGLTSHLIGSKVDCMA
jgi:hypothetical protein